MIKHHTLLFHVGSSAGRHYFDAMSVCDWQCSMVQCLVKAKKVPVALCVVGELVHINETRTFWNESLLN